MIIKNLYLIIKISESEKYLKTNNHNFSVRIMNEQNVIEYKFLSHTSKFNFILIKLMGIHENS